MADVFVVRNQLGHYWGKKKRWVDGTNPHSVLHTAHRDEAINILFELSSKDIELRGEVVDTTLTEKGDPVVVPSDTLLPEEPEAEPHETSPQAQPQARENA
jgi:hypothetical protein